MPVFNPVSSSNSGGRSLYTIPDMPALSGFTLLDGTNSTASVSENSGKSITITDTYPTYGRICTVGLIKPVPSTSPYRVSILCLSNIEARFYYGVAFGFSDGTKIEQVTKPGSLVWGYNTYNVASARNSFIADLLPANALGGNPIWFGLRDDGTYVYFEISVDGVNYTTIYKVAKSSGFLGASGYTHTFFGLCCHNESINPPVPISASFLAYDENGLNRTIG